MKRPMLRLTVDDRTPAFAQCTIPWSYPPIGWWASAAAMLSERMREQGHTDTSTWQWSIA